jgi:hypothetical protein
MTFFHSKEQIEGAPRLKERPLLLFAAIPTTVLAGIRSRSLEMSLWGKANTVSISVAGVFVTLSKAKL